MSEPAVEIDVETNEVSGLGASLAGFHAGGTHRARVFTFGRR